ncbi:PiggyBac transposable element-derived protein 4 [Plakobranchus ocellatus]|uniref:PiggyBac transposable element-derived protein 4 n=1 Tax=Plakobranchus ocellatus TaxID=259542 RepID=A0AAV4AIY9_9GAST|nr:PiggyBac transposable element-derived protein 4 [Plakobranchus ocellatus]
MLPKSKKADTTTSVITNGTLNLLRFYDKREVNILSTAHDDTMVATGKTNPVTREPIVKLHAVADYNKFMGAVDRSDQMVSFNSFRRRTLKWWKKAFFHMFMLAVLNSYLLHKCSVAAAEALSHRLFRRDLAMQLVAWAPITMTCTIKDVGDTVILRLTARHFPSLIPAKDNSKIKNPQQNCIVCSEPNARKRTRYQCSSCEVGLCPDQCFELFHTRKDYRRCLKRKLTESPAPADSPIQG